MQNYTLNITEDEMLYIRKALCDKNLKHTCKAIECRRTGDNDGERFNMEHHDIGHNLLSKIDTLRGIA